MYDNRISDNQDCTSFCCLQHLISNFFFKDLVYFIAWANRSYNERFFNIKSNFVLLTQYCVGDKIEKIEMGGTCGTYGGRERCAQGVGGET